MSRALRLKDKAAGFLMEAEIQSLLPPCSTPAAPLSAHAHPGGAKISDRDSARIDKTLIDKAKRDHHRRRGMGPFTFKKVLNNMEIGASLFDADGDRKLVVELGQSEGQGREDPPAGGLCLRRRNLLLSRPAKRSGWRRQPMTPAASLRAWMWIRRGPQVECALHRSHARGNTIIWNGPPGVFRVQTFRGRYTGDGASDRLQHRPRRHHRGRAAATPRTAAKKFQSGRQGLPLLHRRRRQPRILSRRKVLPGVAFLEA